MSVVSHFKSRVQKYHSKNTVDELPDSLAVWVWEYIVSCKRRVSLRN